MADAPIVLPVPDDWDVERGIAGMGWSDEVVVDGNVDHHVRVIAVAYWLPMLGLLGAATALVGRTLRRNLRRQTGHCVRCGYDLRATPARCPECGVAAVQ